MLLISCQYLFVSSMNYFCCDCTNKFFIYTTNYFSVVLRITFPVCIENYFFIGPRINFCGIANLLFVLQYIAVPAVHFENFASGRVFAKRIPRRNIVGERNERGFHLSYKFKQKPHAAFKLKIVFQTFPVHVALHFIN